MPLTIAPINPADAPDFAGEVTGLACRDPLSPDQGAAG